MNVSQGMNFIKNTNNIEYMINASIATYPTLFRIKGNPSLSRLLVLEHLFCAYGNGYDWNKERGILEEMSGKNLGLKELPQDFFDKNLYEMDFAIDGYQTFCEFLKQNNIYHYVKATKSFRESSVYFESTEEQALEFKKTFGKNEQNSRFSFYYVTEANAERISYGEKNPIKRDLNPTSMCEFSALIELTEGKPSKYGPQYLFKDFPVKKQWVDACAELAEEAIKFFSDEGRYQCDFCHPKKCLHLFVKDYKEAETAGEIEKYRSDRNYFENETVEERCIRSFEAHRQEQLDYLNKFISMWKNNEIYNRK